MLEDSFATTVCERTKLPPWGLNGGNEGIANNCYVIEENEKISEKPKATRVNVKKGNRVLIQCGGGGGYGSPKDRNPEKVLDDYKQGYISKEYIKKFHPEVKTN